MSFDITFIRTKTLNAQNVHSLLESSEFKPGDHEYLSTSFRQELITEFENTGLKFDVLSLKERDHFELNFSSYQVYLFDSQISLAIPYWDENSTGQVNKETQLIMNVLIQHGFIGYDSQMGEFISKPFNVQQSFTESKTVVDNGIGSKQNGASNTFMYIGIGLGVLILTLALRKFLTLKSRSK